MKFMSIIIVITMFPDYVRLNVFSANASFINNTCTASPNRDTAQTYTLRTLLDGLSQSDHVN